MQGLWKDSKKHFVNDKAKGIGARFRQGKKDEKEFNHPHIGYELYVSWFKNTPSKYLISICGLRLGIDISWNKVYPRSSKKWYKELVNSKDRMIIRDYIQKGNYNNEIPTHCYSKSIAWLIS
jgi:hypothetical protein